MVKEWNLNPITHVCVECEDIFFDYTTLGVSIFLKEQTERVKELKKRTAFTHTFQVEGLSIDEFYNNALRIVKLPPLRLINFFDPRKYICTDVLPLLINPDSPPFNLTPIELFEQIYYYTLVEDLEIE